MSKTWIKFLGLWAIVLGSVSSWGIDIPPRASLCLYSVTAEGLLPENLRSELVTSSNIETLFAHYHAPGKFGAKAVAYRDSEGTIHHLFFPIKEGDYAIHHTRALGLFLLNDAAKMERRSILLEREMNDILERRKALKAAGAPYEDLKPLILAYLELSDQEKALSKRVRTYRELAGSVASLRERTPFQYIQPEDVQGFELTAVRKGDGRWVVTEFEVDSIITEHQRVHAGHSSAPMMGGEKMAELVLSIHHAIDPSVRQYSDVYMGSLSEVPFSDADRFYVTLGSSGLTGRP